MNPCFLAKSEWRIADLRKPLKIKSVPLGASKIASEIVTLAGIINVLD